MSWLVSASRVARRARGSAVSVAKVVSWLRDEGAAAGGSHGRQAAPEGELLERTGATAERRGEERQGDVLQHAHGGETEGVQTLLGDRPDAVELADGQRPQAAVDVGVVEHADAGRFVQVGGQLGEQLVGSDTQRAGEALFVVDQLLDATGDGARRPEEPAAAGDVEDGFVDRHRLDQVGEAPEELEQLGVDGGVRLEVGRQEHGLGTQPPRLRHGHGRMNAASARFVGGRGHHAAALGAPTDDHRPAAQLGAARLFDRRKESIHVDVDDGRGPLRTYVREYTRYGRTLPGPVDWVIRVVDAREAARCGPGSGDAQAASCFTRRPKSTVNIEDAGEAEKRPPAFPTPISLKLRCRMTAPVARDSSSTAERRSPPRPCRDSSR